MQASQLLKGEWLEYSGGSRPGTNKIRFMQVDKDTVFLELWYVFDWDKHETQSLAFHISRCEFDQLVEGLLREGHASLDKSTEGQRLHFQWKEAPNGFAFYLIGHTTATFEGPIGVEIKDFRTVNYGKLLAP